MKADYQKLSTQSIDSSFQDFWVESDVFRFHWHYHPEMEICYVAQGQGKRIIGENISDFEDGDLVLVGSNLPHSWISDEQFNSSDKVMKLYVVQFLSELFDGLHQMPEFREVNKLIAESNRGIVFKNARNHSLVAELIAISECSGLNRLVRLIGFLNKLSEYENREFLNDHTYRSGIKKYQEERILKVCNHIHDNYTSKLSLSELAGLIAMNEAAFCRFFKRILGKTAVDYITELRIAHACNRIQDSNDPIYQVAYDAGFSSLTHFNRQFKRRIGQTPRAYKRMMN